MTGVRGGRGPSKAEMEARAEQEAEATKEAARQLAQDFRALAPHPAFRRIAAWLIAQSQMFGVPVGWPHDQLREWTGRAALGHKVFDLTTAADPTFATFLLTSTPKKEVPE